MKIVLVEWRDSASGSSWVRKDYDEHSDPCTSVGILLRENETDIELAPNVTGDHKLHQIAIPKSSIKRMRQLKA